MKKVINTIKTITIVGLILWGINYLLSIDLLYSDSKTAKYTKAELVNIRSIGGTHYANFEYSIKNKVYKYSDHVQIDDEIGNIYKVAYDTIKPDNCSILRCYPLLPDSGKKGQIVGRITSVHRLLGTGYVFYEFFVDKNKYIHRQCITPKIGNIYRKISDGDFYVVEYLLNDCDKSIMIIK